MASKPKIVIAGKHSIAPAGDLEPNPWNPNVQSDFMFEKEKESIREFGFIDPVTVRSGSDKGPAFKKKQIIDGAHRVKAGIELGMTEFPIVDLGRISDARARMLTELLNKLRGENDPIRWAEMVSKIKAEEPNLVQFLPYQEAELKALLRSSEVDWSQLNAQNETPHAGANAQRDAAGKLFKKFQVSLPEATHDQVLDLMRRIKAARKVDDDAVAFKVVLDLAEQALQQRASAPPPAPAQQARKRRKVA